MTIRARYQRRAAWLLKRHKITHKPWPQFEGYTHIDDRVIRAPEPVDARTFYIFAHEVAHIVLPDHRYADWGGREIQADVWALEQVRRVRGWVPVTLTRLVLHRTARIVSEAILIGRLPPAALASL